MSRSVKTKQSFDETKCAGSSNENFEANNLRSQFALNNETTNELVKTQV